MVRTLRRQITWREPSAMKKLWDLTWGLVLVVGLTAVSEFGVRVGYSKSAPETTTQAVSQRVVPAVK